MLHLVKTPAGASVVGIDDVLEGRYRLQRVIGEGGMGTVFLAEHVLIKRRVAIKVLHPDLARDAEVVERFMNEARAAGTLGHPNIVESTDMGFSRQEVPYIVFEYLEGSVLADEIYRLGGLTPRRALKIARQVASALEAAHRAGIVHRDLKSDNVFLTDKDEAPDHVKVLDFGISRFAEAGQERTGGKRRGVMMGTPEFMSPEQITAPDSVDQRTDIYALGVVLYEMLAARTPFLNENKADPHELLHRVLLDAPPPLTRSDLPAGLADMIFDKLLAKNPDARYQTMSEVQGAIEAFISVMKRDTMPSIPPAALPVALEPPAAVLPKAARRRGRWLWLVAALAAGGAAAGWMLTQHDRAPSGTHAPVAAPVTEPPPAPPANDTSRETEQLAVALDNAVTAAELRAQGIATSPMLRAAIETDAATLLDLSRDTTVFAPQPGEVLEIFQLHDGKATSLLRLPAGANALAPSATARFAVDGGDQRIVVTVPILNTANVQGGSIVLATRIDVAALAPGLRGTHAIAVHTKKLGELSLVIGR